MARFSSEKAAQMIGSKFDLILIATVRARELAKGHKPKVKTNSKHSVTALMEIEQGLIGRDYLKRVK